SATVWLFIIALIGGGLGISMAALIGIGGAGGVLAFLPSLSHPAYRLAPAHDEPSALTSSKASLINEPRPSVSQEPSAYSWRSSVDTTEDHSKPFEPGQWRFEDPDAVWEEPAPRPEPSPPPPPPPRQEPPRRQAPQRSEPPPWVRREDRDEHRAAYEIHQGRIRPLTLKAARKRQRTRGRTAAGLAALSILVVGLPTLLVVDHQMQMTSQNAPTPVLDAAAVTDETPAPPPEREEVTEAAVATAPQQRLEPGTLPAFDESAPPESSVLPDPMARLPMPSPSTIKVAYGTPFEYCAAQGDVDQPETAAIGEGLPSELVAGVREVTKIADGEVLWRCLAGAVWVCAQPSGGVACGKVPTPAERRSYCAANPGASDIVAAAGTWRCDGTVPVVPGGDGRTTDPRGFDRLAWLGLTRASRELASR
ncbi:MAG TPA: hypothetical protein VFE52_07070, partial [Devosia sp.]|nr:hypothetical protein [Devosia sp.]